MRAKITGPGKTVIYDDRDGVPFWLAHIIAISVIGLGLLVGGVILLSLTEWGRQAVVCAGLALGIATMLSMLVPAGFALRAGASATEWGGMALAGIGWGGLVVFVLAGVPFISWFGPSCAEEWMPGLHAAVALGCTGIAAVGMWLMSRGPLPVLDRTARPAVVVRRTDDAEGQQQISVAYRGVDGEEHEAELADLIDDSWADRFAPGTTWQVYAFADPDLAEAVVLLTEAHDEVWRDGYKLDGVRMGGESGPREPGPGSPFFGEGAKWTFTEEDT